MLGLSWFTSPIPRFCSTSPIYLAINSESIAPCSNIWVCRDLHHLSLVFAVLSLFILYNSEGVAQFSITFLYCIELHHVLSIAILLQHCTQYSGYLQGFAIFFTLFTNFSIYLTINSKRIAQWWNSLQVLYKFATFSI